MTYDVITTRLAVDHPSLVAPVRLTGGVVVCGGQVLLRGVVVPEQRLVVAVLVPVEGLDLQPAPLWVAAHDPGHGLVHGAGRRRGVVRQEDDLAAQVLPALHAGQLGEEEEEEEERRRRKRRSGSEREGSATGQILLTFVLVLVSLFNSRESSFI